MTHLRVYMSRSSLPLPSIMHNADRHGHFIYRRNTRTLGSTIHRHPFLAPPPPFSSLSPFLERAIPLLFTRSLPAIHEKNKDNVHATQQRWKELYVLSMFSFPAFFKGCLLARERTRRIRKAWVPNEGRPHCLALITV